MVHLFLLKLASWFKTEEKDAAVDIRHHDWASPHTLLLVALIAYLLWVSHLILSQPLLDVFVRVFIIWLPCHAVMHCVTKVCQAWGPNTKPVASTPAKTP